MEGTLSLKVDNLAFGNILCGPDWKVAENGPVFHRIYYVHGGNVIYQDESVRLPLKEKTVYILPINKPYQVTHDPAQPLRCLWFHITTFPVITSPMTGMDVRENSALYHLLKTLEHMIGSRSEENHRADSLLSHLIEGLVCMLHQHGSLATLNNERIIKTLNYIQAHACEEIKTPDLAALAGFDSAYFTRLFKKAMGITPQKYISDYRFSMAARLLQQNMPVEKVAESVGFHDAKAFSRAFRKAKGLPPSLYRKSQNLQP